MKDKIVPIWISAPFIRLLIPLVAGILFQWKFQLSFWSLAGILVLLLMLLSVYSGTRLPAKYRWSALNGLNIQLLLMIMGASAVWQNDIRNKADWIGYHKTSNEVYQVVLSEPLTEKANTWRTTAEIIYEKENDKWRPVTGKAIIYFKKDSVLPKLGLGSKIIFRQPLKEIMNTGNPGSFDYKQYCLFKGITHQVYLNKTDFILLPEKETDFLQQFIYKTNQQVIRILKTYITGNRENGLAEALLIGYKNDLDKDLVQSYTTTGVVHVIAISGMHLGLIYGILLLLTKPLKRLKSALFIRLVVILSGLWIFTLMAGGQPSVLRSAVMFSVIAVAEPITRRTSIYNTLALSAFVLLCINPFWLWDAGFLLSYSAVLSIMLFFQPIYRLIKFENRLIDSIWKLIATTIAAQILTMPVSVYFFHQLPLLFLLTNIVAVPLSSFIVVAEIIFCLIAFIKPVAIISGKFIQWMISFMNQYIERFNNLPFATWNSLYITLTQSLLLTACIFAGYAWLLNKKKSYLFTALTCMICFLSIRAFSFINAEHQKQLIVYNMPHYQMIDVIDGRSCSYLSDPEISSADFSFHIQPSRILHRTVAAQTKALNSNDFMFCGQRIFVIDSTIQFTLATSKPAVDLVVLSKNPKLYIDNLNNAFAVKQIVIDASVPFWKARLWKRDCDSLHMPCWYVAEKGAYIRDFRF